jgi:hypothetical protein
MTEYTDRETRSPGREVSVFVFGDTADEIELAALDEARPFFGHHAQLTVIPAYKAVTVLPNGPYAGQAAGKKYQATVTVRTIEPESS